MDLDTAEIRELLRRLSDQQLTALCFDHFPVVCEDFAAGMTRGQKVQLLLDYCRRNDKSDCLLKLLSDRSPIPPPPPRPRCTKFRSLFHRNRLGIAGALVLLVILILAIVLVVRTYTAELPPQWVFCISRGDSKIVLHSGDEMALGPDEPLILTLCTADGARFHSRVCHWESSTGRIDNPDQCTDVVYHAPPSNSDIVTVAVKRRAIGSVQLVLKIRVRL